MVEGGRGWPQVASGTFAAEHRGHHAALAERLMPDLVQRAHGGPRRHTAPRREHDRSATTATRGTSVRPAHHQPAAPFSAQAGQQVTAERGRSLLQFRAPNESLAPGSAASSEWDAAHRPDMDAWRGCPPRCATRRRCADGTVPAKGGVWPVSSAAPGFRRPASRAARAASSHSRLPARLGGINDEHQHLARHLVQQPDGAGFGPLAPPLGRRPSRSSSTCARELDAKCPTTASSQPGRAPAADRPAPIRAVSRPDEWNADPYPVGQIFPSSRAPPGPIVRQVRRACALRSSASGVNCVPARRAPRPRLAASARGSPPRGQAGRHDHCPAGRFSCRRPHR